MRVWGLILVLIALIVGGLYWSDSVGLTDVGDSLTSWASYVPGLGSYFEPPPPLTPAQLQSEEFLRVGQSLDHQQAELKAEEERLVGVQGELNREKERLSYWEQELERREEALKEREERFENREERFGRFAVVYSSMRPADAAKILETLDDLLVIEIFNRMPDRNVAAILREMDPEVAGTIIRKMSR